MTTDTKGKRKRKGWPSASRAGVCVNPCFLLSKCTRAGEEALQNLTPRATSNMNPRSSAPLSTLLRLLSHAEALSSMLANPTVSVARSHLGGSLYAAGAIIIIIMIIIIIITTTITIITIITIIPAASATTPLSGSPSSRGHDTPPQSAPPCHQAPSQPRNLCENPASPSSPPPSPDNHRRSHTPPGSTKGITP
jgi:hypothetical protein